MIDLGPGAGSRGGQLLFEGTPRALVAREGLGDRASFCGAAG